MFLHSLPKQCFVPAVLSDDMHLYAVNERLLFSANRMKDGLMLSRLFVSVENSLCYILGPAILSCCPRALGEGRYRWRHDQVLRVIVHQCCTIVTTCSVVSLL